MEQLTPLTTKNSEVLSVVLSEANGRSEWVLWQEVETVRLTEYQGAPAIHVAEKIRKWCTIRKEAVERLKKIVGRKAVEFWKKSVCRRVLKGSKVFGD